MEENHNTLKKTADFLLCLKIAISYHLFFEANNVTRRRPDQNFLQKVVSSGRVYQQVHIGWTIKLVSFVFFKSQNFQIVRVFCATKIFFFNF
jgi:hypothetical protein